MTKEQNEVIQPWWERNDLRYESGRLFLGGEDLEKLARVAGTPLFVYSTERVHENLQRLTAALTSTGLPFQIFYALKANRFLPLVTYLRMTGLCGIDVCSPRELLLARQVGFPETAISYTGTSVSEEDLAWIAKHPQVQVNCDSISTIRRLGKRCPGREIGIRINPQLGVGDNPMRQYAGAKPTKFGVYQDRFDEALAVAKHYGLSVTRLHFHVGSGYLASDVHAIAHVFERTQWFIKRCPNLKTINLGGGLGVPNLESDRPFDLQRWAGLITQYFKPHGLQIQIEPGDYIICDAGALILQVNTVEQKRDVTFVGVDGGFNIQVEYAYYNLPQLIVPLQYNPQAKLEKITVAGQINEGIDLFAEELWLPQFHEGDYLALLNTGGYGSSMSSNHCMRGGFSEYLLWEQ